MLLFDKGYLEIRNTNIHPLSKIYLQYRQLKNNNIKSILLNKATNVKKINTNEYIFYFNNKDDILKGILGDIFLFYIKTILQKKDFELIFNDNKISPNWNIVTYYYKAFYASSLLLRLCFRGNLFLDLEYKKCLEYIVTIHTGEVIKLDSNYFYYIEPIDDLYQLRIEKSQHNTHETVWEKMNILLQQILLLSNSNSDEQAFLHSCLDINQKLGNKFPSQLRNRVNYQPLYGLKAVDKELYSITENGNWVKEILSFDVKDVKNNDNRIANVFVAYSLYIEKFAFRLIQDYFAMSNREDHILAYINKFREDKIEISEIPFFY